MFPSTNMGDYTGEMDRLFPKNRINNADTILSPTYTQSPFHSTLANRSSSSADSTSPESYFDMPINFRNPDSYNHLRTRSETPRTIYESPRPVPEPITMDVSSGLFDMTPIHEGRFFERTCDRQVTESSFLTRRQRPIVGRKFLGGHSQPMKTEVTKIEPAVNNFWPDTLQSTPPENIMSRNYELFPSETRGYEFRTPVKNTAQPLNINQMSPQAAVSPAYSNYSSTSNIARSRSPHSLMFSPNWSPEVLPSMKFTNPYMPSHCNMASSSKDEIKSNMCTFCRKNGERPIVYMTHSVKELVGNKYVVSCPILRSHVCSTCGASGDNAHTITYCPVLRSSNNGKPLQSTTITLKNTRRKSDGRRRF